MIQGIVNNTPCFVPSLDQAIAPEVVPEETEEETEEQCDWWGNNCHTVTKYDYSYSSSSSSYSDWDRNAYYTLFHEIRAELTH